MTMNEVVYEPMPGKIVAKLRVEEQRSGLILLSDPANSRVAEVVAVYEPFQYHLDNPDAPMTEAYVKVGDLVIFGRHNGVEITVGRDRLMVLKETEILTKIRVINLDEIVVTEGNSVVTEGNSHG
jgi:co-chaperonin GroES (HSP10)